MKHEDGFTVVEKILKRLHSEEEKGILVALIKGNLKQADDEETRQKWYDLLNESSNVE
jgi:hypothetical protein